MGRSLCLRFEEANTYRSMLSNSTTHPIPLPHPPARTYRRLCLTILHYIVSDERTMRHACRNSSRICHACKVTIRTWTLMSRTSFKYARRQLSNFEEQLMCWQSVSLARSMTFDAPSRRPSSLQNNHSFCYYRCATPLTLIHPDEVSRVHRNHRGEADFFRFLTSISQDGWMKT